MTRNMHAHTGIHVPAVTASLIYETTSFLSHTSGPEDRNGPSVLFSSKIKRRKESETQQQRGQAFITSQDGRFINEQCLHM